MKKILVLLGLISIPHCSLWAQTNQVDIPKQNVPTPKSTATIPIAPSTTTTTIPIAPPQGTNRIVRKQITYSGALIQLYKTDNPLQLLNPFAPASYGSGYANLSIDPVTKKPAGIALFSINF